MSYPAPTFRLFSELDQIRITRIARRAYAPGAQVPSALSAMDDGDSLAPQDMPSDIITMNSRFVLQDADGNRTELTLCYPEQADFPKGFMSVMSPMGGELLGRRVGETVQWQDANGAATYQIHAITYQPEANGDFTV